MASKSTTPATPYSPKTHPQIPLDALEVGSLYIMISVPLPIYIGRQEHTYPAALPSDPAYPFSTYELGVSSGSYPEEFHWDLYWHTSDFPSSDPSSGSGIIYRLRSLTTQPPTYAYDRVPTLRVRTHAQLVGLVRVVSVPRAFIQHMTRYLDWMTAESARVAERSFVWAVMAYYRARAHLAKGSGVRDHTFHKFDISRFTAEVLSFAYAEVPRVLGGDVGPKKVVAAWLGIMVGFLEDEDVDATRRRRDELVRRQREEVGAVSACWYR
ncbi:hypothetical protein CkaCkLH20_06052 [Colletotrichum karsti]|uniref:Uncharacterized protein n=1 Tax=Colletotrichum karsti TaxID=1095194 RepID=A0A9P6LHU1_9PEZI|nr:uncharacterized protein CkaCkLH20_06052 [Colletotrichum karsti]KAF9876644.1 hypothetical protein CkaCkLH20_06052 [Colletotrichum karsti]